MKGQANEALECYREGLELARAMSHKLEIDEFEKRIAALTRAER